jgi:seryl-tRNA(Sec) selenium transferase
VETTTSIYEEIGIVPAINAMGNYTVLGGSTPSARVRAAMDAETASVLHVAHCEGEPGSLSLRQVLDVAHGKGVPVVVDAAGQVYPLERFTSFTKLGADLVCFGAKYIGSVNSSGILCGKKDLVEAASMQGFIGFETVADHQAFGRPMKLDRQEVVAVVVALQEWFAISGLAAAIDSISGRALANQSARPILASLALPGRSGAC